MNAIRSATALHATPDKLRAVIIDDEPKAIAVLRRIIENHCPQVEVVAVADEITSAIRVINEHRPQLLLLDVDLTSATGFDLLERIEDRSFHVILVTAHPEYAVKAFRYSVIDYLMKPVDMEELKQAVEKVRELIVKEAGAQAAGQPQQKQTLRIPSMEGAIFVRMDDILRLEAEGAYTRIYVADKRYFSSYNLKHFEDHLDPAQFIRVHRSHVVNLQKVKALHGQGGPVLELVDGSRIPVSRGHKADLLKALR